MEIYLIIYFSLLISSVLLPKSKAMFWCYIVILSFLIGFRGINVGADTVSYDMIYREISSRGYGSYPEPLYGYINELFGTFGFTFQWFQTILTGICLSLGGRTILKRSPNISLSLFFLLTMFFVFYAMNGYRQTMACFLLLFAYDFLLKGGKNDYVIFTIMVFIAIGFHKASICAFILPFIINRKFSFNFIVLAVIISLIIGLLMTNDVLSPFVGGYEGYLSRKAGTRTFDRTIMAVLLAVYWVGAYVLAIILCGKDMRNSAYLKMNLVAILINNILIKQEQGLRVVLFFSILQVVTYPLIIEKSNKKMQSAICLMFYISIFFFTFLLANSALIVPYYINRLNL